MMISVLAYLGLADLVAGMIVLAGPRLVRLEKRRTALPFFATGVVLATVGAWWPHRSTPSPRGTLLAAALPEAQFGEFHAAVVRAPPDEVWQAVRTVTANEIGLFRVLTWIRSPRIPGTTSGESILAPDWRAPILDVALRSGFVVVDEQPGKELVIGTVVCCGGTVVRTAQEFLALSGSGLARAAMDFRIEPSGDGSVRLTTATRVLAAGSGPRRKFGLYWSIIYPGSALIRRGWLDAIRRRAESAMPDGPRPQSER